MTTDELKVIITAQTKDLTKSLDQTKAQLGEVKKQTQKTTENMSRNFTKVKVAIVAVGVALGAMAKKGLKASADMESIAVAYRVIIGDAERAKATIAELNEFIATTPFQKMEVFDAGRQLLAYGESTELLTYRLRQLGDIASGVQMPLETLVDIYGRVSATGQFGGRELQQLARQGVPIYRELAEVMGVSESAIGDLVSQGKIGFAEMDRAFRSLTAAGGMFAGMMEQQSQTLGGLWSNLRDSMTQSSIAIGDAVRDIFFLDVIIPAISQQIDGLTQSIANLSESTKQQITSFIAGAMATLSYFFIWLKIRNAQSFLEFQTLLYQPMRELGPALSGSFSMIFKTIKTKAGALFAYLKWNLAGLMLPLLVFAGTFVATQYSMARMRIAQRKANEEQQENISLLRQKQEALADAQRELLALEAQARATGQAFRSMFGGFDEINTIGEGGGIVQTTFSFDIEETPEMADLKKTIAELEEGIEALVNVDVEFNEGGNRLMRFLFGENFEAGIEFADDRGYKFWQGLIGMFGLGKVARENDIGLKSWLDGVNIIFKGFWEGLKKDFGTVGQFIKGLWDLFKNGLKDDIATVKGWWSSLTGFFKNNWKRTTEKITELWENIKLKALSVFSSARNTASNWINGFTERIRNLWSTVALRAVASANSARITATNWIRGFRDALTPNSLDSVFKAWGRSFAEIFNRVIRALNNRVKFELPSWIPGIGGNSFGLNIKELAIPRLARGGIVSSGQIFMAGEQGKEAIVPLENNLQWLDKVAEKLGNAGGNQPLELVIQLGGTTIAKQLISDINQLQRQEGRTLIRV